MVSLAWSICRREVDKAGSTAPVAKKIGYARSSVALYLAGRYTANVDKIEKKIIGTYTNKILCPYTNEIIEKRECEEVEKQSLNTSNPVLFKLQLFCLSCPVKHNKKEEFISQFKKFEEKKHD
jgi:hypothetical protein|nr:MAG TPA: hypothetical protein [Caudoviricetes sp.]